MKGKSRLTTTILLIMIVILIFSIFYISFVLSSSDSGTTTSLAPKKTKAANLTYKKYIALNQTPYDPTPTVTEDAEVVPTEMLEPITPTETISAIPEDELIPTVVDTADTQPEVSPTETVLAYNNPSVTIAEGGDEALSPTKVKSLPESGFVNNALILAAVSGLLIFVSFIF